jgi:hypothetical protein
VQATREPRTGRDLRRGGAHREADGNCRALQRLDAAQVAGTDGRKPASRCAPASSSVKSWRPGGTNPNTLPGQR